MGALPAQGVVISASDVIFCEIKDAPPPPPKMQVPPVSVTSPAGGITSGSEEELRLSCEPSQQVVALELMLKDALDTVILEEAQSVAAAARRQDVQATLMELDAAMTEMGRETAIHRVRRSRRITPCVEERAAPSLSSDVADSEARQKLGGAWDVDWSAVVPEADVDVRAMLAPGSTTYVPGASQVRETMRSQDYEVLWI